MSFIVVMLVGSYKNSFVLSWHRSYEAAEKRCVQHRKCNPPKDNFTSVSFFVQEETPE